MAVKMLKPGAKIDQSQHGYGLTDDDFDVTYVGATFGIYERNMHDDSDFYAVVWTGEAMTEVMYGTTRGWSYANRAWADATDEVKDAARAWLAERLTAAALASAAEDACRVEKDKRVTVVKGRKARGESGKVFWRGTDSYRSNRWATFYRVGVKLDSGEKVFLSEDNVLVENARLSETREQIAARVTAQCERIGTGTVSGTLTRIDSLTGQRRADAEGHVFIGLYRGLGWEALRSEHSTDERREQALGLLAETAEVTA